MFPSRVLLTNLINNHGAVCALSIVFLFAILIPLNFAFAENTASPLKQLQQGVSLYDVKCNDGKTLILKYNFIDAACVTSNTASVLIKRGWGEIPTYYFPYDAAKSMNNISTKVAFIGDQGIRQDSIEVLNLIKNEKTDLVLHQGDFDYVDDPTAWENQINKILGSDFPYFASVGNHDVPKWEDYQIILQNRLSKIPNVQCNGDIGVNSSCTFNNLFFILSGVGTMGTNHDLYISEQLSADDSIWKICSWHKNMKKMQLGKKSDETGWNVYDICLQHGAIIATGHEHSYSRTKTLVDVKEQLVDSEWNDPNNLRVDEGKTFVFVSGLGGQSIRNQDRCLPFEYPYGCNEEWAKIYTSDQNAKSGALFCTFGAENQINKAFCYFKNIDDEIIDEFYVTSFVGNADK